MHDVIVIGAGMAGLICARQLVRVGLKVLVLEKSADLGGRLLTHQIGQPAASSPLLVDVGTPYITADTDRFHRLIKELVNLKIVQEWTRSLHVLEDRGLHPEDVDTQNPCYICPQGMAALVSYLAKPLTISTQTEVIKVEIQAGSWVLTIRDGRLLQAGSLVMAIPAPQVLDLLEGIVSTSAAIYAPLHSAKYHPCLVVLAGYEAQLPVPTWKGIKCSGDPMLAWVGLESSKREPADQQPVVVVHATAEFSANYLEADAATLQQAGTKLLKQAARRLESWLQRPAWMQIHLWPYAQPTETVGLTSIATRIVPAEGEGSAGLPLVCAGDWCAGAKVEGAWLSGNDAAERLLSLLGVEAMPSRLTLPQS